MAPDRSGLVGGTVRRSAAYQTVVGLIVGSLLAGLVVAFASGERETQLTHTAGAPRLDAGVPADPVVGSDTASPTDATAVGDATSPDGPPPAEGAAAGRRPAAGATASGIGASSGPSPSGGAATASGSAVRLGFVLLDLGSSGGLGFNFGLDPKQQERAIRALVDQTNERGGLAGHPIEPRFATFNVLDTLTGGDSGRAVCLKLTEDDKVFAVVGYLFPADQLCVTKEHRTPMLSDGANNLDSTFAQSEGRLLSVYPRAGHLMESLVAMAGAAGFLRDQDIGIVGEAANDPLGEVAEALAGHLRRGGFRVSRISRLSADLSQGASQMPVEVNQQRVAGSDVMILLTNPLYVQQFAQQAESQGWFPRYGFSDFANGTTDPANDMPESLNGAFGVAGAHPGTGTKDTTGFAEPAAALECRQNYERRTGERLPPRGGGDNKYAITLVSCDDFRILREIAAVAGSGFDATSFVAAAERVGAIDGLARIPGGSFGPGKRDLADHARIAIYDASCQCFHPRGPFRRTR